MDIITTIMMVVALVACGLGCWRELVAQREAKAADERLKVVAKDALDSGWAAGIDWFSKEWAKQMALRAVSSKNGVTVTAELVGGVADGCQVVVGKDQDFVWLRVGEHDVLYLFAHRSHKGRWVFEFSSQGSVVSRQGGSK